MTPNGIEQIDRAQVTETGPNSYVTEASSLGWAPGHWPNSLFLGDRVLYRGRLDAGGAEYLTAGGAVGVPDRPQRLKPKPRSLPGSGGDRATRCCRGCPRTLETRP